MSSFTQPELSLDSQTTLRTRDGREVLVRHMRQEDAPLLEAMFYRLSSATRYRRFFLPLENVEPERVQQEAANLARIDPAYAVALLALAAEAGGHAAVGVARFARLRERPDSCEASIVLRDDYQGAGLGGQLLDLLVLVAMAYEMRHMILLTHADNQGMIALVRRLGLPYQGRLSAGLYEIDVQLGEIEPSFFPFTLGS